MNDKRRATHARAAPAGRISSAPPPRSGRLAAQLLIVLAVGLVYGRSLGFDFVSWDDPLHVTRNPYLRPPWRANLAHLWQRPYEDLYIPASYTVFAGEAALADWLTPYGFVHSKAAIFHAAAIALHAGCALLVLRLLWLLTGSLMGAACGALLFALHPLQVESVAWISETRGLLSAIFSLLAISSYLRFASRIASSERSSARVFLPYGFATLCFLLALLSKPSAVVLPLIIGLLDLAVLNRSLKQVALALAPWLLLAAADMALTRALQPAAESVPAAPLWARPLIAGDALAFYLAKLVWPWELGMHYDHAPRTILDSTWLYAAWLAPAIVLLLAWAFRRTGPWLLCAAMFVLALLPVLGFVPFLFQQHSTVADRYVYLALLGPAWALAAWVGAGGRWRASITIVVLVACGALSFRQVGFWRDSETLYTHALKVNPRSYLALNNLGEDLLRRKRTAEAIPYFQRALVAYPADVNSQINLGSALAMQGDVAEAAGWFRSATQLKPAHAKAWANLGTALASLGQLPKAAEALARAAKLEPQNAALHYQHADILRRVGRYEQAIAAYEDALRLRPGWVRPMNDLAWLLATTGDERWRDPARALNLAERAAADSLADYATLDTHAAAQAAAGQFEAATKTAQRAHGLAIAAGDKPYAAEIARRIELYKKCEVFRETTP